MVLNNLKAPPGSTHKPKRVGRGQGSGQGTTAGRGTKGQSSRSGGRPFRGFEGGQMPIQRRLPKFGFHNHFRKEFAIVNVSQLARFDEGAVVDIELLIGSGLVKKLRSGIKILGQGEITKALTVKANGFSSSAREKIEKAGGKVEEI